MPVRQKPCINPVIVIQPVIDIQEIPDSKVKLQHQVPVPKLHVLIHETFQLAEHGHELKGQQVHIRQQLIVASKDLAVDDSLRVLRTVRPL